MLHSGMRVQHQAATLRFSAVLVNLVIPFWPLLQAIVTKQVVGLCFNLLT